MENRVVIFPQCNPPFALKGNRIAAVGAEALQLSGPAAQENPIAAQALPGFHDSHIHLGMMARQRAGVDCRSAKDRVQLIDLLRQKAASLPAGQWIYGHHWPADQTLSLAELDTLPAPLFIHSIDTHSAQVNSATLSICGIDERTAPPPGGVIEHDGGGRPTGVLRENAAELARSQMPPLNEALLEKAFRTVAEELRLLGITSVHAIETLADFQFLQQLHAKRPLPLRVFGFIPAHEFSSRGVLQEKRDGPRLIGAKVFLDGSLGSGTAEMLDGRGVAVTSTTELIDVLRECHSSRLNCAMHAIGDGAVRRALDAVAQCAFTENWWRPRIEHAQCVAPDDLPRFAQLKVIASMQPAHAIADREHAMEQWSAVEGGSYAWNALLQAGARLAFGSDAPVDDPSPLHGIEAAATWRQTVGWHPELSLTRSQAVDAYTAGAAYAAGCETHLGKLAAGQTADLVLIADGAVAGTILRGEFQPG